ncbi:MAG: right-handed parallel beta-helix repeat-containing protein [Phycisphaerae bacterium]|nr:right-handed parallel beta-helix repeat-containing protein [Phycisphaerae bacterium]
MPACATLGFTLVAKLRLGAWCAIAVVALLAGVGPANTCPAAENPPPLEIVADTVLDPAKTYGRIVVKASDVTIDGRGAWLIGANEGQPKDFRHIGVYAQGISRVTLRNLNVKGWDTGLQIEDGSQWRVENCDFSDNFHDPDYGWGEQGRRGGIVLTRVHRSTFTKNKANRVWDACAPVDSNDNTLEENDFSHTSDTGLKLWTSCRNLIRKNNFSYGLRIKPGDVHAQDSTCVLIESGSNDNRLIENDCTHGGDGVFVRVLNGWVSTGNLFERNDTSYAHNNCVEAWSPRNVYRGNKANHGSYGFWLGASDQTVLIDNEASYNGVPTGHHNSPHLPDGGHAGIVFIFGPSSHTLVRGNTCVGNNGAGIALVGDISPEGPKFKALHWIIEQNTLAENRWGIYMRQADWVHLAGNVFRDNRVADVQNDGQVTNLVEFPDDPTVAAPPKAVCEGPLCGIVGRKVVLDASGSSDPRGRPLRFRWDLGDGTATREACVEHAFPRPGFYRVGLTVDNGRFPDLAWRDFYAVEDCAEQGTEGQAADWGWIDPQSKVAYRDDESVRIAGKSSVAAHVEPYGGMLVSLLYPTSKQARLSLEGKKELVFWIKAINENVPTLNYLTIAFDSWGAPPLRIWIDGMALK